MRKKKKTKPVAKKTKVVKKKPVAKRTTRKVSTAAPERKPATDALAFTTITFKIDGVPILPPRDPKS